MRVSVRDVALKAGVSRMTVTNVLNGREAKTSPETRERVLRAAREMNYIPVPQPASQRRHIETGIIGISFDELNWEDYWGLQTYKGLRVAALEKNYDLLTVLRQPATGALGRETRFMDRRSDGYIFMLPQDHHELFTKLVKQKIPVVSCYIDKMPDGVACVTADNREAMRLAVHHLAQLGHERILYLNHTYPRSDFQHRKEGYLQGMDEVGLEPFAQDLRLDATWCDHAVETAKKHKSTALICPADTLALSLKSVFEYHRWQVPRDLSIIGMDDVPEAAEAGLTTMRIFPVEIGRQAIDVMVNLIQGGDAENNHRLVPVQLVERDTVAAPP